MRIERTLRSFFIVIDELKRFVVAAIEFARGKSHTDGDQMKEGQPDDRLTPLES